jgi:hypothetical protein
MGALIMLGTLFGLIVLIFGLVLRYDPEARRHGRARRKSASRDAAEAHADQEARA